MTEFETMNLTRASNQQDLKSYLQAEIVCKYNRLTTLFSDFSSGRKSKHQGVKPGKALTIYKDDSIYRVLLFPALPHTKKACMCTIHSGSIAFEQH